ncbi:hypothetical protein D3C75_1058470 [compost metagenome]
MPMCKNLRQTLLVLCGGKPAGGSHGEAVAGHKRNRAFAAQLDVLNLLLELVGVHGDQQSAGHLLETFGGNPADIINRVPEQGQRFLLGQGLLVQEQA